MGARKKLVARISKSEPLILKSKPLIFCPLKTILKTAPECRQNTDNPPAGAVDQLLCEQKQLACMP